MTLRALAFIAALACAVPLAAEEAAIRFVPGDHRIDVLAGETPVTSYIYPDALPKPSLYPIRTPAGVMLTRNYPQTKDESKDHAHHVGIFFAADGVNGNQFWLNTSRSPRIEHVKAETAEGGTLITVANWIGKDETIVLEETRQTVFRSVPHAYVMDFMFTLKAVNDKVTIVDPKEALFGIRVADWMREEFSSASGVVEISGKGDGHYLNSKGSKTEKQVWGRRAEWVRLEAQKDGKTVGIAVFDHPSNVNHPTYWHARGYGLFAANPVGQMVFQKAHEPDTAKPLNFTIDAGKSATFRYRVLIYDGARTKEQLDAEFAAYAK